jgi:hypothetical protein
MKMKDQNTADAHVADTMKMMTTITKAMVAVHAAATTTKRKMTITKVMAVVPAVAVLAAAVADLPQWTQGSNAKSQEWAEKLLMAVADVAETAAMAADVAETEAVTAAAVMVAAAMADAVATEAAAVAAILVVVAAAAVLLPPGVAAVADLPQWIRKNNVKLQAWADAQHTNRALHMNLTQEKLAAPAV